MSFFVTGGDSVVVAAGSPVQVIEDLQPGCRVAGTDDPDVNLVGMIMLEPADLEVIVAFREEREIGKLLRAMGERKCAVALATLRELLASKVAETLILWCIGDLFRQALRAGASYGNRSGWSRGANPYSTSEIAPLTQKNYAREELLQAMRAVRRADLGIKSSWKDSRILLEFLVWQIVVGKESSGEGALGGEIPLSATES